MQDINHPTCPNCNAPITGVFCARCGQRVTGVVLSMRRILRDLLEDQFSLNSTLVRTIRGLAVPGFLTSEYLQLRIARYVPPFRLYLIASFLFFLVMVLSRDAERITRDLYWDPVMAPAGKASRDSANAQQQDSLARDPAYTLSVGLVTSKGVVFGLEYNPFDTAWARNAKIRFGNSVLNQAIRQRLVEQGASQPPAAVFQAHINSAIETAPKIMFLLVPVFALILKLLYARRKRLYVEHFIFALHVHAFVFLIFLLMWLGRSVPLLSVALFLSTPIYLLFALRRVYGQGWGKTALKWIALGASYFFVVWLGLMSAFVAAVFMT